MSSIAPKPHRIRWYSPPLTILGGVLLAYGVFKLLTRLGY